MSASETAAIVEAVASSITALTAVIVAILGVYQIYLLTAGHRREMMRQKESAERDQLRRKNSAETMKRFGGNMNYCVCNTHILRVPNCQNLTSIQRQLMTIHTNLSAMSISFHFCCTLVKTFGRFTGTNGIGWT